MIRRYLPGLMAGLIAFAAVSGAHAQPSPPAPPPGNDVQNGGPPAVEPQQRPVFAASSLEVTQLGALTMIKVYGMAATSGWREPTLVPLSRGVPPDGVLDIVLVAEPPPETMAATGFAPVMALLLVAQDHPYSGVRVRAATNVLAVAKLPGTAEAGQVGEDCRACVGRTLGDTAGPGMVSRAALPKGTRVLGPADPFPDAEPNPNRLTLLVGTDGKVSEAVWQ